MFVRSDDADSVSHFCSRRDLITAARVEAEVSRVCARGGSRVPFLKSIDIVLVSQLVAEGEVRDLVGNVGSRAGLLDVVRSIHHRLHGSSEHRIRQITRSNLISFNLSAVNRGVLPSSTIFAITGMPISSQNRCISALTSGASGKIISRLLRERVNLVVTEKFV
jgi:hypothetical protein